MDPSAEPEPATGPIRAPDPPAEQTMSSGASIRDRVRDRRLMAEQNIHLAAIATAARWFCAVVVTLCALALAVGIAALGAYLGWWHAAP